jgi:hypothetical protein
MIMDSVSLSESINENSIHSKTRENPTNLNNKLFDSVAESVNHVKLKVEDQIEFTKDNFANPTLLPATLSQSVDYSKQNFVFTTNVIHSNPPTSSYLDYEKQNDENLDSILFQESANVSSFSVGKPNEPNDIISFPLVENTLLIDNSFSSGTILAFSIINYDKLTYKLLANASSNFSNSSYTSSVEELRLFNLQNNCTYNSPNRTYLNSSRLLSAREDSESRIEGCACPDVST